MDYSFLRLKPTLAEALNLEDSPVAQLYSYGFLCLNPNERYLQITNSDVDIIFNDDYIVHVADMCGNNLLDITDKVFVYEGTNSETGIKNIAFEIINIGKCFYREPVILKFTSSFDPELVFYSNPFVITNQLKGTMRIDYRSVGVVHGVDYYNFDFMQSIRVIGYLTKANNETEKKVYTQLNGNKISPKNTIVMSYGYNLEWLNNFFLEALTRVSENDIIYIDGQRATSVSFTTDELFVQTNFFKGKLTAYKDKSDTYAASNQIAPAFELIRRTPTGARTTNVSSILGTFGRPITIKAGTLTIWNKTTSTKVYEFAEADIVPDGTDGFLINLPSDITTNAEYYINFTSGLFVSVDNDTFALTSQTDWAFKKQAPDWLSADWNNIDFLT